MIKKRNLNTLIEIDGGVNTQNSSLLYEAGADVLVAGNAIFTSQDKIKTIRDLQK